MNDTLIDNFKEKCKLMQLTKVSDGEGGFLNQWTEGTEFYAAIVKNSSLQARIAEKQGVTALYTVTTATNVNLDFHDVFKRVADNKIFRVTSDSNDTNPPSVASFSFLQVSAEEWVLPL